MTKMQKFQNFRKVTKFGYRLENFQQRFLLNYAPSGMDPSSFPTLDQIQRTN